MEISNNASYNTSFGMAFKKPLPGDMGKFVEYVTKGKKPKYVERGLKQLQAQHADDVNFDFFYTAAGDQIHVVPKSEKAKEMYRAPRIFDNVKPEEYPSSFELALRRFEDDAAEAVKDKSKIKQFCVGVKGLFNMLTETFRVRFVDKTQVLPANMRMASDTIRKRDAKIAKQIAKEELIDKSLK